MEITTQKADNFIVISFEKQFTKTKMDYCVYTFIYLFVCLWSWKYAFHNILGKDAEGADLLRIK